MSNNIFKQLLPISVLILGGLICTSSFFPELKSNAYSLALALFSTTVIVIFIIKAIISNKQNVKTPSQSIPTETWQSVAINCLTTNVPIAHRNNITLLLLELSRRIDDNPRPNRPAPITNSLSNYLNTPLEVLIQMLTPHLTQEKLAMFNNASFKSAFQEAAPIIRQNLTSITTVNSQNKNCDK